jgi:hypothetical protein
LDFTAFIADQMKAGNINEISDIGMGMILYIVIYSKIQLVGFFNRCFNYLSGIFKLKSNLHGKK